MLPCMVETACVLLKGIPDLAVTVLLELCRVLACGICKKMVQCVHNPSPWPLGGRACGVACPDAFWVRCATTAVVEGGIGW